MKKIAVLGYGTVGSGVVELFYKNRTKIEEKAGMPLDLAYILDLREFADSQYAALFTKNLEDILNDEDVSVVAECMGGVRPAFDYLMRCLSRGISVVTSNKELIAEKGAILLAAAKEHSCNCFFEASVGGAIPIIRPLHRCLAANEISGIYGILNGTTNFILNEMLTKEMSFNDALSLAQELGYAERDPSADVDGLDACRKICILGSLAFGRHIYPKSVSTTGIREISLADAAAAAALDGAVKLIAFVKKVKDGKVLPAVMPMFVPHTNLISRVDGVFNCIEVDGDAIDRTYFCGRGAGKFPTASAVMGDVIEAAKHNRTVFSQDWENSESQDFVAGLDALECGVFLSFAETYKAADICSFYKTLLCNMGITEEISAVENACLIRTPLSEKNRQSLFKSSEEAGFHLVHWMPVLHD